MSSNSTDSNIEASLINDVGNQSQHQELVGLCPQAERLQQLVDNLLGVIYQFQLDPDGSVFFLYVSSGCREILELEPKQIQQNAALVINLLHPEDSQRFSESLAFSAKTLTTWHWEGKMMLPSGQLKWVQAVSRPQRQSNGQIIWNGWLLDMTECKQAESQPRTNQEVLSCAVDGLPEPVFFKDGQVNDLTVRKQTEAELYKSKQLLQMVMDTIPQLIFWKDKQLVYLGCNYNFARAVGVSSPEDVVGKTDYCGRIIKLYNFVA